MSILKAITRMLIVGIFRWPAFALMKWFSMDDALHKLLYLLLIRKKYGTVKKMLKQLSAGSTKSETSKLTMLEENLLLEAQVWEHRLRRDFETKAVTRLAAIYEKQCLESRVQELQININQAPPGTAKQLPARQLMKGVQSWQGEEETRQCN